MSNRKSKKKEVVSIINPVASPKASAAAARTLLKGSARKSSSRRTRLPAGPSDKLYAEAGQIGAGLVAVGTAVALARNTQMAALVNACKAAEDRFALVDLSGAKVDVRTLGSMLGAVCDGVRAIVAIIDPTRAAAIPRKTGFEKADPLAYAQVTVHALGGGSTEEKHLAQALTKVADRYTAAQGGAKSAQAEHQAGTDQVNSSRAALRSFIQDCRKFITDSTPHDHQARHHLKRKPTPKPVAAPPAAANGATTTSATTTSVPAGSVNVVVPPTAPLNGAGNGAAPPAPPAANGATPPASVSVS
ncbi:MAG: hypothetical protein JST54_02390 [Deltaproteobacteria bacterium]|nr:hypothetical protein [Deltaproteobacteria bacterium]